VPAIVTAAGRESATAAEPADFERLEARLVAEFSPPLQREEVRRCLIECAVTYQSAAVRNYVELLVERDARKQMRALASGRSGSAATPCRIESSIPTTGDHDHVAR
jgi:hypothetical protein